MPPLRSFHSSQIEEPYRNWKGWHSAAIWLALAVTLILGFQNRLYSTSIDVAAHGTLVSKLMASWSLPDEDVSLAEMAIYPRVAHQIASLAGHLTGSAIKGMQETVILSLFLLWTFVGMSFSGLPRNRLIAALVTLSAVIIVGHLALGIEFFGSELISSYFFAQLVAQSLGMAILVLAMRKEWSAPDSIMPIAILGICVPLLASVHLLAALELLGTLAILALMRVLKSNAGTWISTIITSAGIVVASTALLAINPDVLNMIRISANNGGISLRYVESIRDVIGLAILSACVFCFMLFQCWRKKANPISYLDLLFKYFGAFGLATAGLCLIQIFLLQFFALGSVYACLKYAIALQTLLAIAAALLVALCIRDSTSPRKSGVSQLGGILFASAICACIFATPFAAPTEPLVAAEADARQFVNSRATPAAGKYDLVFGLEGVPDIGNYFISRGVLGSPSFGISMDVLFARIPKLPEQVNQILTTKGSKLWDIAACRRGRAGALMILDGACVYKNLSSLQCKGTIEFASQGALDQASDGFSNPDRDGRWSEGQTAMLTCEQSEPIATVAYLDAAGLVSDSHSQSMTFSVNGGITKTVEFSTQTPSRRIEIPLPGAPKLTLRFTFPDAISPAELGINADQRKLAVKIYRLRFE